MKKFILSVILVLTSALSAVPSFAAGSSIPWDKAPDRLNDLGALQNGAKLFVTRPLTCALTA